MGLPLIPFFLLTNNYLSHQQFIKKVCNSSIFLILVTKTKKFIGLKSKTKYTSKKKKKNPTTKITNNKTKKKKLRTNFIQNKQSVL